jgi:hypothetical protein
MRLMFVLLLWFALPAQAQAQENDAQEAAKPPACTERQFRAFDFWIGDWEVSSNGELAGVNTITSILGGCALQENWQGAGPGAVNGSSFNIYDRATDQWHQTWVDDSGTLLELNGGIRAGAMVLTGARPATDGKGMTTHRISWTRIGDGTVRQLWEASKDEKSWTILFDGLYTRKDDQK